MSDSDDEFFGPKKHCPPLIDSEDEAHDERSPSNDSIRSSQTAELNSELRADAMNQSPNSVSVSKKSDKLPSKDLLNCNSDNESSATSQSVDKDHSESSQPDRRSQRSQSSSVSSVRRKSCSNSDNSDSDSSRSILVSNRSTFQQNAKKSSPDLESDSRSNTTLVSNRNITKSSVAGSESDSSESGKAIDTSINSIESGSVLKPNEKLDNLSDTETIVKPKSKRYKLLSDDDISEDDGNHSPVNRISGSDSGGNENVNPTEKLKLKKDTRKKKLKLLNELKRNERKEKSGNVSSDSDCENHETFNSSKGKHSDSSRVSSDNSAASESENEISKTKNKSNRKSLPQRKSKKIDPKLEIKSKTQKMIRENRISLPYHQPKKRSLDEFLARRKNTPSIPLKATNDVLHVVSEHLMKREKEVEVFYKSESDHSENDDENADNVEEPANNPTSTPANQGDLPENWIVPLDNPAISENNAKSLKNEVEIQGNIESTNDVPSCDPNPPSSITAMDTDNCEDSMDLDVSTEKGSGESSNQVLTVDACVSHEEKIGDTDLGNNEVANITEDEPSPSKEEINPTKNIENRESNSLSDLPVADETQQNLPVSAKAIANPEQNLSKENPERTPSEELASKEPLQNDPEPPDTEDFDLMIRDSCNDTDESKNESETSASEPAVDLRSKKLALLSRLKIPLRSEIKLQACPDMLIELESPSITESEFGVYELKKKFAFHSSMRNQSIKLKSSTKLSIIRTETDSHGEIIDVVKEVIDVSCGEEKEDKEKEFSTPGAKHLNFKEHMLKSLIEKKQAKWQEHQEEKRKLRGELSSDEEESDKEYSEKPDFEPYHPEDELDDEELEEDDVDIKEKRSKKNDFVDDEAEVSCEEDEDAKESDVEEDESEKEAEAEEPADDEDEAADDEADAKADEEEEDGDAEMLDAKTEEKADSSPPISTEVFKKPLASQAGPLFKYNTTGTDLENKILGFESIFGGKSQVSQDVSNSQLFEICSGKFATQVDRLNSSYASDMEFFQDSQHGEDSQNINLSLQDTSDGFKVTNTSVSNNRSLLFLSDESDNEELFARKKKLMRLEDSDDEADAPVPIDEANSDEDENEEEAAEPNDEDAEEVDALGDDEEELAYNSEEEIITKEKAAEFFENEAELSESEWGSDDENEQNLDVLEKEAGDDDILDEDQVKKDLEKIHMRQVLDDDQEDVRMLKEMFLEDGELHSDGKRQRKFQWSNLADDNGFFSKMTNDSDEEVPNEEDEEEADTNWRKIRHEREMFISQQEKREDLLEQAEDETSDSLPLPKANAGDIPAKSNKPNATTNNNISSPDSKLPFKSRFKCGSFLTRSKMLLDRLAVTVGECKENITGKKAKNHRNFVFAAVSPEKEKEKELPNVPETKTEKRKISSKSVIARKRLKLTSSTNERGLLAQLAKSE